MCGLYANTTPFYIRDLSIHGFQVSPPSPGNNPLWIPRDDCTLGCRERGLIDREAPEDFTKKVTAEQRSEAGVGAL